MQVIIAHQPDEAVAQLLTVEQDEDRYHDDEAGCCKRPYDRRNQFAEHLDRSLRRKYLDEQRLFLDFVSWRLRNLVFIQLADLVAHALDDAAEPLNAAVSRPYVLERAHFRDDVVLISRYFAREFVKLQHDNEAYRQHDKEGKKHADDDGKNPGNPHATKPHHHWLQNKSEQNGYGKR